MLSRSLLALSVAVLALGPDAALATPDPNPAPAAQHDVPADAPLAHRQLLARAVKKSSSSSSKKASTSTKKASTSTKKAAAVKPAKADAVWDGTTTITQTGKLLVGAMQLVVVSDNAVVVLCVDAALSRMLTAAVTRQRCADMLLLSLPRALSALLAWQMREK